MNQSVEALKTTTFYGRRFTRKRLVEIQQVVSTFPKLSRWELGLTLCEHLQWLTPRKSYAIQSCLNALQEMEAVGLITLPAKIEAQKRGPQKKIIQTAQTNEQAPVCGALAQVMPLSLDVVTDPADIKRWHEFVDRYHYLGYKRPIGSHLRYYLRDNQGNTLGCLLFSFAVQSLPCRDDWIGWEKEQRQKRLHLILNNTRFLIFPWVNVTYLASKALSLACKQLPGDWEVQQGYRPVLLETFIDTDKYTGVSYRAANWQWIGKTAGKKPTARREGKSQKDVYIYPLSKHFKSVLINGERSPLRKKPMKTQRVYLDTDDPFVQRWGKIIGTVVKVANAFDQQWQQRRRVLSTLLLVLFIFRLVLAKNKQGYGTTVVELWAQCRLLNIPLPQTTPVAASAFCNARKKLDEQLFKRLNTDILKTYATHLGECDWKQHRLFAVAGSKLNLPRALIKKPYGYKRPGETAYYPQGLLSCLYRLKPKLPIDFDLVAHGDERQVALTHLHSLQTNDVVVYDRGYFSYAMLYFHIQRGIHPLFRIKANLYAAIDQFSASDENDKLIDIFPSEKRRKDIQKDFPDRDITPLKLRLLKYKVAGETYTLGTTLFDKENYPLDDFPDVYHARWGIEELYKISKQHIDVEDFHAQSERGIKQELFAHFVLITLTRIFSNHTETGLNSETSDDKQKVVANFKHSLITVARNLEALFLQQAEFVKKTVNRIVNAISICKQKRRPNRSYDRASKKPVNKGYPEKGANTKAKTDVTVVIA